MTRARAKRSVRRIRARLGKLFRAEKNRDAVTAKRKAEYLRLRNRLRDDHPDVRRVLRRYRASRDLSVKIDHTEKVLRARAKQKLEWLEKHPPPLDADGDGLVTIDGRPVVTAIAREVIRIRKAGRWKGIVVSGFRSPEHSESLCFGICGAPVCPGKCAGRTSRHTQKGGRDGAIDVSDFFTFADECRRLGSWLENHLPNDLVHFSDIGN